LPVRFLPTVMTEIRRGLAAQHAHARGLADPVRTEEANDFPFLRDRDAEESEGVLPVLVDEVFLERFRKADNPNRIEGTFLDTDPAADAGFLADRRFRGLRIDPDDLRAGALRGAEGDALEMTAQDQKIWTFNREPIVRDRAGAKKAEGATALTIPDEDVKLVAEKAGVSEEEALKALEDAGGEPAEAIIRLMSR